MDGLEHPDVVDLLRRIVAAWDHDEGDMFDALHPLITEARAILAQPARADEAAALRAEVERLRSALGECIEDLDSALGYVDDYFRDKWFPGGTTAHRAALAAPEPAPIDPAFDVAFDEVYKR